jgi:hypothetical protein
VTEKRRAPTPDVPADDADRPELLSGGVPRHFGEAIQRADSYGTVFLALVVLIWVVGPFLGSRANTEVDLSVSTTIVVGLALHTSRVPRSWLWVALGLTVATTTMVVVGRELEVDGLRAAGHIIDTTLLLGTAGVIMHRVFNHRVVTFRTIFGAVSTYLIVGVAFAQLFIAIDVLDSEAFGSDAPIAPDALLYLSLVTLATLGYGDVTPVSPQARSAATFETIMGQIFLVTIVARLVGLFGQERSRQGAGPSEEATP